MTRLILDRFGAKALTYVNLGNSQLSLGYQYWEPHFAKVDVLQLSLSEVRRFFSDEGPVWSLERIFAWFKERHITAVVTLDRFGAVATHRDRSALILCWPYELRDVVDTTGAGDAFGAGMVASLRGRKRPDFPTFHAAVTAARLWAAYACTTLGGANDCPSEDALERFEQENRLLEFAPVEVTEWESARRTLRLLDKAYLRRAAAIV